MRLKQMWMTKLILILFAIFTITIQYNKYAYGEELEQNDLDCLSEAIYYEARGDTFMSQLAVGTVIMNRVRLNTFPNTICKVVHQGCQFSYYCDGLPEKMLDREAKKASYDLARFILSGATVWRLRDATHYHAFYVNPYWANVFTLISREGAHLFYSVKEG